MSLKRGTMLYLAATYLAFCFPSEGVNGEELVLRDEMTLGVPTLICDKVEDVIELFELVDFGETIQEATKSVEGCGWLLKEANAKVTAIGTFETDKNKYLLVRFDFLNAVIPPQYSVAAIKKLNKA